MLLKVLFLFFLFFNSCISASVEPKTYGSSDTRFKTWTYYKNTTYKYIGYYFRNCYIEFENGERVGSILIDKPTAWLTEIDGSRLFLKPIEDDADCNATVMTNKRTYFFNFVAREAKGPFDKDVSFFIKFRYPRDSAGSSNDKIDIDIASEDVEQEREKIPEPSEIKNVNLNYTVSGDNEISPEKIYDDGVMTYLRFKKNKPLPSIYSVNSDKYDEMINYRINSDVVEIEGVYSVYTLRYGSSTLCVYNENLVNVQSKQ